MSGHGHFLTSGSIARTQLAEDDVHGRGENASHFLPTLLGVLTRGVGNGHSDDTLLVREREAPSQVGAYTITCLFDVAEFYLRHVLFSEGWAGGRRKSPSPDSANRKGSAAVRSGAPNPSRAFTRATPLPPWPLKHQLALGRGLYANVPNLHRFPKILNLLPVEPLCT